MNEEERLNLQTMIIGKIEEVKKSIESFKDSSKPVSPDNAIGRLTRMEAINSKSISDASLAKSKQTLKALQHSLKMIDDPEFGYCIHCEEPIPYKRLLIMPEARFCVACAQKLVP